MNEKKWIIVGKVQGDLAAEIIKSLLEAQNIPVMLSQEGAGRAIGITIGPMGEVEILVPNQFENEAKLIIKDYETGYMDSP